MPPKQQTYKRVCVFVVVLVVAYLLRFVVSRSQCRARFSHWIGDALRGVVLMLGARADLTTPCSMNGHAAMYARSVGTHVVERYSNSRDATPHSSRRERTETLTF